MLQAVKPTPSSPPMRTTSAPQQEPRPVTEMLKHALEAAQTADGESQPLRVTKTSGAVYVGMVHDLVNFVRRAGFGKDATKEQIMADYAALLTSVNFPPATGTRGDEIQLPTSRNSIERMLWLRPRRSPTPSSTS